MYSTSRLVNQKHFCRRVLQALIGHNHLFRQTIEIPKRRIGSLYGGWWVATNILNSQVRPVIISCGIGGDISFDKEMIDLFSAVVFAFDPTPKSLEWLASQTDLPFDFHSYPFGVAEYDGSQKFGSPSRADWDDYSVLRQAKSYVTCQVKRIETIVRELSIETVDVLKLDIEGSEYAVIEDLLSSDIRPKQLLVEYHYALSKPEVRKMIKSVLSLMDVGYFIFDVSPWGREFSLVHQSCIM